MTTDPLEPRLRETLDAKAKPVGSLGRLEELAVRLGTVQQSTTPTVDRVAHLIFAGDHGIAAQGVSAYPQEVTRAMLGAFLGGGAAACVLARVVGAQLTVVDAGCPGEPVGNPDLVDARVGAGTADCTAGPAMTAEQCAQALAAGSRLAVATRAEVVGIGAMGIGLGAAQQQSEVGVLLGGPRPRVTASVRVAPRQVATVTSRTNSSAVRTPQSGQSQVGGTAVHAVPGAKPSRGAPVRTT